MHFDASMIVNIVIGIYWWIICIQIIEVVETRNYRWIGWRVRSCNWSQLMLWFTTNIYIKISIRIRFLGYLYCFLCWWCATISLYHPIAVVIVVVIVGGGMLYFMQHRSRWPRDILEWIINFVLVVDMLGVIHQQSVIFIFIIVIEAVLRLWRFKLIDTLPIMSINARRYAYVFMLIVDRFCVTGHGWASTVLNGCRTRREYWWILHVR